MSGKPHSPVPKGEGPGAPSVVCLAETLGTWATRHGSDSLLPLYSNRRDALKPLSFAACIQGPERPLLPPLPAVGPTACGAAGSCLPTHSR